MSQASGSRTLRLAAVLVTAALAVSGCAPERPPLTAPPPSSPIAAPVVTPKPPPEPTDIAPLTGMRVPVGSLPGPSLAAKVDNNRSARPQIGLERTDIVFEELVEGGLTRYLPVWHSDIPETIGPVRSIRPMDPFIISPFGGVIAYSGGQYRFVQAMKDTPVYNAIHGQRDTRDTFRRARDRPSPHDVLVSASRIAAEHAGLAAPQQQFQFALDEVWSTAAAEGKKATSATLAFSTVSKRGWVWSEAKRRWLRSQDGEKDLDSNGAQLSAANVVVLRVRVVNDRGVPRTEMVGDGEAWVMTEGRTVHGTWTKGSKTAPIVLADEAGEPILLVPGNTWVELVPTGGSVNFTRPAPPVPATPPPTLPDHIL